ncbi:TDP-N-acetylfucosamine:lipid II N-acetylfucosaminyltransferase [Hyunsoonleella aestuarii]|uniref:TDP-N-acetylfucosamine:lipid II N-acetylfucosaminyltransferase n=1 Tax=Hyunsoonleella aestuarii TaxID=912802 RepID=A0ABP8E6X9_9FLAO|nr:TDP-N-acetylfucosamine:lipid II N-acetylfucosaminyltransferase [Hyunsoonleella aestuarii]
MKIDYKILHICNDEKFIDSTIKLFEDVYPNKSIYYVLQSTNEPFKHVRSEKAKPFLIQKEGDEHKIKDLLHENKIEVVFLHALHLKKQRIVNVLSKDILKVWFIWGSDLYWNWKLLKKDMFERETYTFLYGENTKTSLRNKIMFNNCSLWLFSKHRDNKIWLPKILVKKLETNFLTDFYKVVQKIDIAVPIVPAEYELVKRINNNLVYAPFEYANIEDLAINNELYNVKNANNILVGNSASPTNNHIDAFKQIVNYKQDSQKVIVPLSYGGKKDYINFVIEKGNYYFGDSFIPILNFMPLNEYNQLISGCGFAVFNHKRQQALGNINTMGYFGAKLFLNSESPIFKYFKKLGIQVFNINSVNSNSFYSKLSEKEIEHNRSLLFKLYSREAVKKKVVELIEIVDFKLKEN